MGYAASKDSSKASPSLRKITVQLAGSRRQCEQFCDGLKKGLKGVIGEVGKLKKAVAECYSEFLLRPDPQKEDPSPDVGLGKNAEFKYPGDARKLGDRNMSQKSTVRTSATWGLVAREGRKHDYKGQGRMI